MPTVTGSIGRASSRSVVGAARCQGMVRESSGGPGILRRVSPYRPDLVDCWIFRVPEGAPGDAPAGPTAAEVLLIRRSPGRILPGLWQCVSGSLEDGERVALGALREVHEETGFGPDAIVAFYDLDLVNQFHEPSVDGVMTSAVFALRVRPATDPILSIEHTGFRWVSLQAAWDEVVWPGYRDAIERVRDHLLAPEREPWFRLRLDGERFADGEPAIADRQPEGGAAG